jgi:hypothetical protein
MAIGHRIIPDADVAPERALAVAGPEAARAALPIARSLEPRLDISEARHLDFSGIQKKACAALWTYSNICIVIVYPTYPQSTGWADR